MLDKSQAVYFVTVSKNHFEAVHLGWRIWPWGIKITHGDTDVLPECSMEFGVHVVRPKPPYKGLWARLNFEHAAFARSSPHQDWEELGDVTGYHIVPIEEFKGRVNRDGIEEVDERNKRFFNEYQAQENQWLSTGICPDPGVYFSTDSDWLDEVRGLWAERQRARLDPDDAVHYILDGRDGYVEVVATRLSWKLWEQGEPLLSDVSGEPLESGFWSVKGASHND